VSEHAQGGKDEEKQKLSHSDFEDTARVATREHCNLAQASGKRNYRANTCSGQMQLFADVGDFILYDTVLHVRQQF